MADITIHRTHTLGLPAAMVLAQLGHCRTFGELWEWAQAHSPSLVVGSMPLSAALLVLPRLIRSHSATLWRANAAA